MKQKGMEWSQLSYTLGTVFRTEKENAEDLLDQIHHDMTSTRCQLR